jgi:AraC-like DNA-binding protein
VITRHASGDRLPRHRHAEAYAAVVLAGSYVEAGDHGRWRASPGTVIVHGEHEAHADAFGGGRTVVLNLPTAPGLTAGAGMIDDVDAVARAAERDPLAAAALAAAMLRPVAPLDDWPDLLARALGDDPALRLDAWARTMGLAPASISRGFARAFGVSPKRFRLEARTRRAWRGIVHSREPLAAVAAAHGFADQAHMTRAVAALTGASPGALRVKSVQARGDSRA